MRLWTFQDRRCVKTLMDGDKWYCHENKTFKSRTKEVDKQYITTRSEHSSVIHPIYCFSKLMGQNGLSLQRYVDAFTQLTRYYSFDLESGMRVMLELEVPSHYFLNMKTANIPSSGEYEIVHDNYKVYSDLCREDVEVLLPYINPMWIVAIREFKEFDGYVTCKTAFRNSYAYPAWLDDVSISGDGCVHVADASDRMERLNRENSNDWIKKHSMHGAPGYFTLSEALECCDDVTYTYLLERCQDLKISKDKFGSVTVRDLGLK